MTIDATAPIAIPWRRRVRDSPRRIEGTCMAFGLSIRGTCTVCSARSNGRGRWRYQSRTWLYFRSGYRAYRRH